MGCGYGLAKGGMMAALNVYFDQVEIVNEENIPKSGPVIFVANHYNQFVDPMILLKTAGSRKVSFIIAEKSMHRPVIGDVARALGAVPVIRPQDKATPGQGKISKLDLEGLMVEGESTNFTVDCAQKGCLIAIKGVGQFAVDTVVSDTELKIKPVPKDAELDMDNFTGSNGFKVVPKIDQDEVFQAVYDKLLADGCIGIFPEGGSHDRTDLLPLKAGVSLMALGAAAKGAPVKVVAVGINYFKGHAFRSKAFVNVAKPLEMDDNLISEFLNGNKREACGKVMDQVKAALESVVIRAPNYEVLKAVRTARRMYQNKIQLNTKDYMKLNQRFTMGFEQWGEDPVFQRLLSDINTYLKFAFAQGLSDKEVRDLPPLGTCTTLVSAWFQLIYTFLLIIVVTPFILPGLILNLPIPLRTRCVVEKEMRKALAGSTVKIAARDVAASQKIIQGATLIPTLVIFYTIVGIVCGFFFYPFKEETTGNSFSTFLVQNAWWLYMIFFLFLFPVYTFYVCIKLGEYVRRKAVLIPSLFMLVFSVCRSKRRHPAEWLRQDRKRLVIRVQQYVEEHIHEIPEWANDRIITSTEIKARRSERTLHLMESGDLQPQLSASDSQLSFVKQDSV